MKTQIIGLRSLRENIEKYVVEVSRGREFVVVRRSKPIFKLSSPDVWGDRGTWETVLDFSKLRGGGIPARKFFKVLKASNERNRKISS